VIHGRNKAEQRERARALIEQPEMTGSALRLRWDHTIDHPDFPPGLLPHSVKKAAYMLSKITWMFVLVLVACSPHVKVEQDKAIKVDVNVKIDHDVRVKLDRDSEKLLSERDAQNQPEGHPVNPRGLEY
jgi:YnbE-like lipoprotein